MNNFNDDFDGLFDDLFGGMWNRFNSPVKDMSPYKAYEIDGKGYVIVCKTLGIAKEDISVRVEKEKGQAYPVLKIKGETTIDKINFTNKVDLGIKLKIDKMIENVNYEVKDGLTIIYLKTKAPIKDEISVNYIDDGGKSLDW